MPFARPRARRHHGAGASLAFFSYIGFDAITTAGEEVKNPRRNIPIAILICIGVVTLLYCAVALAAIGALGADAGLRQARGALAGRQRGHRLHGRRRGSSPSARSSPSPRWCSP